MSDREFIHDIVLQVAVIVVFFAIMGAITRWNCARCDAVLTKHRDTEAQRAGQSLCLRASVFEQNKQEVAK